jgi:hypothetical protein
MPVEDPYIFLGQLITFFYFLYFITIIFISILENSPSIIHGRAYSISNTYNAVLSLPKKTIFLMFFVFFIIFLIFYSKIFCFYKFVCLEISKSTFFVLCIRVILIYKAFIYVIKLYEDLKIKIKDFLSCYHKKLIQSDILVNLIKNLIFLNFKLSGLSSVILVFFGGDNTFYLYVHVLYLFLFLIFLVSIFFIVTFNYKKLNLTKYGYILIVCVLILPVTVVYLF